MLVEQVGDAAGAILGGLGNELEAAGYSASWQGEVVRSLQDGTMSGLVARLDGHPTGIIAWSVKGDQGRITLLAARRHGAMDTATELLEASCPLMLAAGARLVTHILRDSGPPRYREAHARAGFMELGLEQMALAEDASVEALPDPTGYRILAWRSRYTSEVVAVYRSIPRDPLEAIVWPQYDTIEGVYDLVESITTPGPVQPPPVSYVAEDELGRVVAYSLGRVMRDGSGRIGEVGVHPDHRRHGLGRALVTASTRAMLVHGLSPIRLTVLRHNTPARQLYLDLGFVPIGTQWAYIRRLDER